MNAPVRKERNVQELHLQISHNLTKFANFLKAISQDAEIKMALQTSDKAVRNRSLLQIGMDDAMDAFADVVAALRHNDPVFTEDMAPIGIYHQLLASRDTSRTITRADALTDLKGRVADRLRNPLRTAPASPLFFEIAKEAAPAEINQMMAQNWSVILQLMAGMMNNEDAIITSDILGGMNETFKQSFNKWAEGKEEADATNAGIAGRQGQAAAGTRYNIDPRLANLLKAFGDDLTAKARNTATPAIIGRTAETNRMITNLVCDSKPFSLTVGKEGTGKSSLTLGLAQRIAKGQVPDDLKDAIVMRLNLREMKTASGHSQKMDPVANQPMSYDMFTERLSYILKKTAEHNETAKAKGGKQIILVLDEMGDMAGNMLSPLRDVKDILASALDTAPGLRLIGEVTEQDYNKMSSSMGDLLSRFREVKIAPLSGKDTLELLKARALKIRATKQIAADDVVLDKIAKLSNRYVTDSSAPQNALELLDISIAQASLFGDKTLTMEHVADVLSEKTGVPKDLIGSSVSERIGTLREKLPLRVIGQDAILKIVENLEIATAGMKEPNKPLASYLAIGPTGVGKTETGEAISDLLGMGAPIRIDMGNYKESHTVSRLIGSPPGYVGYNDTPELEQVASRPYSVIIFDEIEKAHPDVMNVLLAITDKGEVKLQNGKVVDFRNSIVLMTSNIGAQAAAMARNKGSMGLVTSEKDSKEARGQDSMMHEVKGFFKPEFLNRLDGVLVYNNLNFDVARKIALSKIAKVSSFLSERNQNLRLELTAEAKEKIAKAGFNPEYGARPMDRSIKDNLKAPLTLWFNKTGQNITKPTIVRVTDVGDKFALELVDPAANDNANDKPAQKPAAPAP